MKKTMGRLLAVTTLAASLLTVWSGSAQAATRYTVSTTGAKGVTDVGWVSEYEARPVNVRLYDTLCDGKYAYSYFKVTDSFGRTWRTTTRKAGNGCNTDENFNSYIHEGDRIKGIRFYACRSDVDNCDSVYIANPLYTGF